MGTLRQNCETTAQHFAKDCLTMLSMKWRDKDADSAADPIVIEKLGVYNTRIGIHNDNRVFFYYTHGGISIANPHGINSCFVIFKGKSSTLSESEQYFISTFL